MAVAASCVALGTVMQLAPCPTRPQPLPTSSNPACFRRCCCPAHAPARVPVHQALSHLSADAVFLSLLNTWLADLVVERSDANLHVLLKLLEVLALLRSASWAGLTSSGLCVTVKKATGHRNRDVGNKSTGLLKVGQGRLRGGALGRGEHACARIEYPCCCGCQRSGPWARCSC